MKTIDETHCDQPLSPVPAAGRLMASSWFSSWSSSLCSRSGWSSSSSAPASASCSRRCYLGLSRVRKWWPPGPGRAGGCGRAASSENYGWSLGTVGILNSVCMSYVTLCVTDWLPMGDHFKVNNGRRNGYYAGIVLTIVTSNAALEFRWMGSQKKVRIIWEICNGKRQQSLPLCFSVYIEKFNRNVSNPSTDHRLLPDSVELFPRWPLCAVTTKITRAQRQLLKGQKLLQFFLLLLLSETQGCCGGTNLFA